MTISHDPLAFLIDFDHHEPNVRGIPLALVPTPLDDEQQSAIVELHARGRAASHLDAYARRALDLIPAAHHVIMCEAISDMIVNDACDDLVICIPPGGAKTTYASVAAAAWYMGKNPNHNIILATHTAELAENISRRVRDTIATEEHRHIFPTSAISPDSRAAGRWGTTLGGQFLAVGAGASILGFRANVAFQDDVIGGYEVAQSETQLAKLHNWFETDLITRLKPGGKICLVCQRLSPNDMAGYMIARHALNPTRRLRLLTIKMEAVEPTPGDPATIDPLGRAPGERLWPEYFTQQMVEDARRDDYKWRTLYQQEPPSSSGEWVGRESLIFEDQPPGASPHDSTRTYYILSDLALSINKGDYSVHIVVSIDHEEIIRVEHAWRERAAVERTVERHLDLVDMYHPQESLIDDDNAAKVYVQLLASKARERGTPVPWKALPMRGQDKETRAAPLRGLFRSRRIRIVKAPWNDWLVKEILMFPNAMGDGVDDGVDALGLIGRRLLSLARPAGPTPLAPKQKTWQDVTLNDMWDDREHKSTFRKRV